MLTSEQIARLIGLYSSKRIPMNEVTNSLTNAIETWEKRFNLNLEYGDDYLNAVRYLTDNNDVWLDLNEPLPTNEEPKFFVKEFRVASLNKQFARFLGSKEFKIFKNETLDKLDINF